MTTTINRVTKDYVWSLVVQNPDFSEDDIDIYRNFIQASTILWVGHVDDELLCFWGVIPPTMLSDQAYLWLYTTEASADHEFILVRRSQIALAEMKKEFPRVTGHCSAQSPRSIRWLKWLGAKFGEPEGRAVPFVI